LHNVTKKQKSRRKKPAAHHKRAGRSCLDRVGVVAVAKIMTELSKLPAVRKEKILKAKKLIEEGKYETEEKLDIAINKILKELRG